MSEQTSQERHEQFTLGYYNRNPRNLAEVRAGLDSAAHMCDAIAQDILREHTSRGRNSKRGLELAAAVKRAGDAIWQMRDKITVAALLCLLTGTAQAFPAIVTGIHDGDTVSIVQGGQTVHIRVAGIDAPERAVKHRWQDQPYADQARAALTAIIGNQPVDVECTGQKSYDRPVCRLYACKDPVTPTPTEHGAWFCPPGDIAVDVQRAMVAEGAAWSAIQYEAAKDQDAQLPVLEAQARAAHRGLWGAPAVPPWTWRHSKEGHFSAAP